VGPRLLAGRRAGGRRRPEAAGLTWFFGFRAGSALVSSAGAVVDGGLGAGVAGAGG
jgi:hypothetical protein